MLCQASSLNNNRSWSCACIGDTTGPALPISLVLFVCLCPLTIGFVGVRCPVVRCLLRLLVYLFYLFLAFPSYRFLQFVFFPRLFSLFVLCGSLSSAVYDFLSLSVDDVACDQGHIVRTLCQ